MMQAGCYIIRVSLRIWAVLENPDGATAAPPQADANKTSHSHRARASEAGLLLPPL